MRRFLNFWRLQTEITDDGYVIVEFYRTRRGSVITRVIPNT